MVLNMILPLIPSYLGFPFALGREVSFLCVIQCSPADDCSVVSCSFGVLTGEDEYMYGNVLLVDHT